MPPYESIEKEQFYSETVRLYIVDLCVGICVLRVFLQFVKRFETLKALCKFIVIIIIIQ